MANLPRELKSLSFIEKLNGPWHERALWVYLAIVILHWVEHLFQAAQIWILQMPRPEALGALGYVFPWLVKSEAMHFTYAVLMFAGLVLLRPGQAQVDVIERPALAVALVLDHERAVLQSDLGQRSAVETERVEAIGGALAEVASRHAPIDVTYRGLGAFPSLPAARVLWMGVDPRAAEALRALVADVDLALSPLGFRGEARAFQAHLTLARVRDGRRPAPRPVHSPG